MKILHYFSRLVALASLLVLILPVFMYLGGAMALSKVKSIMLGSTIFWFIFAVIWLWHKQDSDTNY